MLKPIVADINIVKEEHRGLYTQTADGAWALNISIEGHEPVAGLKAKTNELLGEVKTTKSENARLQAEATARAEKDLIAKNEFDKVLASRQADFDKKAADAQLKIDGLQGKIKNSLMDKALTDVATQLFGKDADIFKPSIAGRFDIIEDGDGFSVQIKDINGNASAMTSDQLIEEFKADERLQKFIVGRESSGGGAPGGSAGTSVGADEAWATFYDRKSSDFSLSKQIELEDKDPEMHKRLSSKFQDDIYTKRNARPTGRFTPGRNS